ncbi:hypothetical protein ElyMa_003997700 [Elysia marginata]|uniref:Uncharacterized protein n=1 Tax=Elysia marginata TaxID=1093978 RepID=A0AAV4FZ04_9GAST|nr:hypothetical protein ElyMa_003997700 [Elysia marginata]
MESRVGSLEVKPAGARLLTLPSRLPGRERRVHGPGSIGNNPGPGVMVVHGSQPPTKGSNSYSMIVSQLTPFQHPVVSFGPTSFTISREEAVHFVVLQSSLAGDTRTKFISTGT